MPELLRKLKKTLGFYLSRLFGTDACYYINGAETLPPPLSEEEEEAAIATIDTEESRRTLVEHNLRLVVFVAKKFENTGAGIEELISLGTVGLMKAVDTFNAGKNIKLATYAARCIENEILMFLRRSTTRKREISIDEPLSVDWDGNELLLSDVLGSESDSVSRRMEDDEERRILRRAVEDLDDREKLIVEMRFGFGGRREMTQKEVADALGISQSYISRLEKKIMMRLKKEIETKI